ncbi:MAG TPA: substrate-binding domain-containing protein [Thermoanaerobaculia bacterium]|jgi:phosphate transport system substrate-binding protein|nr:substrate-binding domain-containing protein [Thermoanaerobaculia bacterium]
MRQSRLFASLLLLVSLVAGCKREPAAGGSGEPAAAGGGRDVLRIVGSSTVYPFATAVAEHFARSGRKAPVIESTGTGGGLKLFCAGAGIDTPDIANASRKIKGSEIDNCKSNGVDAIVEVPVGYDGIVIANTKAAPRFSLTRRQLFLALAKQVPGDDGQLRDNPNQTWRQVDKSLPDRKIEVLGPPTTSGTRDAFIELVMEEGCSTFSWVKALKESDEKRYKGICDALREDGAYVDAGENDNLIVQKLGANANALGIFGYSFLDQNRDKLQGSLVENVEPTFDAIAARRYPVSRELFIYVKRAHVDSVPGIREFVGEFVADDAVGEDGYLGQIGLIPLPAAELGRARQTAAALAPNVAAP